MNITVKDENGNKIVIPAGFRVIPHGGRVIYNYGTNHDPCVQDGIVIADSEGNAFVWVPVGTIKNKDGTTTEITLGRYTFDTTNGTPTLMQNADNYMETVTIENRYQELTYGSGNTAAKNLGEFVTKTKKSNGYYIARYEASGSSEKATSKQYEKVNTSETQETAANCARNMYNSKHFDSDLINSYMWDTALVFIQLYSGQSNYANQTPKNVAEKCLTAGASGDVACNIHDMASNCSELTTEHNDTHTDSKAVYRAGACSSGPVKTQERGGCNPRTSNTNGSFRVRTLFRIVKKL